jgi:hypothetical protein
MNPEFIQQIENILLSRSKKDTIKILIENKKNKIVGDLYEQSLFHLSDDLGRDIEDSYKILLERAAVSVFESITKDLEELKQMNILYEKYNSLSPSDPAVEPELVSLPAT